MWLLRAGNRPTQRSSGVAYTLDGQERLIACGRPGLAAVAAAMRKLLHLAWGVIHSDRAFDPKVALA